MFVLFYMQSVQEDRNKTHFLGSLIICEFHWIFKDRCSLKLSTFNEIEIPSIVIL